MGMAASRTTGSPSGRSSRVSLGKLPPELVRVLAYASAIGAEFPFDLLRAAIGAQEEPLAEDLERLVALGLLRERAGGGRFAFVEEEDRGAVYRSMTESRLRVLHRKIAEALERASPEPSDAVVAELGRHYFLGKVAAKSYTYNRRAAATAQAAHQPSVAIHHLERAQVDLASLGDGRAAERAEVAEALGDLSFSVGAFRAADRHYREALEAVEHERPHIRARLLLARAEVARESLEAEAATAGAREALRLFEADPDPYGEAQAYRILGRVAFQRGRYRDALDETMRALETLPPGAEPTALGRLSIDLGNEFTLLGDEVRPVAVEWYQRAVERLRTAHDWAELARALHNLGSAVGETRPDEGLELLERAREAAGQAHDARAIGRALLSGVELRIALGQLEEAERDNDQAGRLLEGLADALGSEQVTLNRGRVAEKRGRWDDAAQAYFTAAELARKLGLTADEADAQLYLARLRFKTHEVDAARAAFDRATELKVTELSPRLERAYLELKQQLGNGPDRAGGRPKHAEATELAGDAGPHVG
jgi:tetratricopeptide (TPR) repeat protein